MILTNIRKSPAYVTKQKTTIDAIVGEKRLMRIRPIAFRGRLC